MMPVKVSHRALAPLAVVLAVAVFGIGALSYWWRDRANLAKSSARLAAAETRMWEAYYRRDGEALARELMVVVRGQFGLSEESAHEIARHMAHAAGTFELLRDADYERTVLPELEQAYELLKRKSGRLFDAHEAARAELAWWIARRKHGLDEVNEVGAQIARLYGILFGGETPGIKLAAALRAKASYLRDTNDNWAEVQHLLEESYRVLLSTTR